MMTFPNTAIGDYLRNKFGQPSNMGGLAPNVPLSGGAPFDPSTFTPNPRPQTPFMPAPMGANLGFPSGAPTAPPQFGPEAVMRQALAPPPGNAMPPVTEVPGQTAAYNQAPGTVTMGPMARPFNPQMYNLGLGLMQRGGSQMAGLAQYLPSIFKMGR